MIHVRELAGEDWKEPYPVTAGVTLDREHKTVWLTVEYVDRERSSLALPLAALQALIEELTEAAKEGEPT